MFNSLRFRVSVCRPWHDVRTKKPFIHMYVNVCVIRQCLISLSRLALYMVALKYTITYLLTLNIKFDSGISQLCLWLQHSWFLYFNLNRTIAKIVILEILHFLYAKHIAWQSLEMHWHKNHYPIVCHTFHLFYINIMKSLIFVTFLLFPDDKTVKNKGHGLFGFYISNLSYTCTTSTTRGPLILA